MTFKDLRNDGFTIVEPIIATSDGVEHPVKLIFHQLNSEKIIQN